MMVMMAEKSSVPVCVHLDHGDKLEILQEALEMGFTSVMYDGSVLPFEENAAKMCIRDRPYSITSELHTKDYCRMLIYIRTKTCLLYTSRCV